MARWVVERSPTNRPQAEGGKVCFRVHPDGEPKHWVVSTNPALSPEAQDEFAQLIAELLSGLF